MDAANDRLRQTREQDVPWKKWAPYLSERQWGTVREDYSQRRCLEYELLDTGVFDADRYFHVFVEYAKAAPEDVLVKITACPIALRGRI